jgi:hypothetical protein
MKATERTIHEVSCPEVAMIGTLQKKIKAETKRIKDKKEAKSAALNAPNVKTSVKFDNERKTDVQRQLHSAAVGTLPSAVSSPVIKEKVSKTINSRVVLMNVKTKDIESALKSKTNNKQGIPLVSMSMTIAQMKAECKVRDSNVEGLSKLNKSHLLDFLVEGSEVEGSSEWISKSKEELLEKHVHKSLCHHHLLADSREIPAPAVARTKEKRFLTALCDIAHHSLCQRGAYRSCAQCDFDICKVCYEIESLSSGDKEKLLKSEYDRINREKEERENIYRIEMNERVEVMRRYEEKEIQDGEELQKRLDLFKGCEAEDEDDVDETKNIPSSIKRPEPVHLDAGAKLKFTVWTSCGYDADRWHSYDGPPKKEFDSSYNSLMEANERVEYVFFYNNPWGCEKEEMYAETNVIKSKGTRFMTCRPDDSERWTVSTLPSIAFDYINDDSDENNEM